MPQTTSNRVGKKQPKDGQQASAGASGEPSTPQSDPTREQLAATRPAPTAEAIAARAYQLYLARGASEGADQEDWFAAERELRSQLDGN